MKTYMIIERFRPDLIRDLYKRFDQKGRLMPEGVEYLDSWIDENMDICFQLMQSESMKKLQEWIDAWSDLADFEIYPVMDSAEARKRVLGG